MSCLLVQGASHGKHGKVMEWNSGHGICEFELSMNLNFTMPHFSKNSCKDLFSLCKIV
jgi:hypothetical protein